MAPRWHKGRAPPSALCSALTADVQTEGRKVLADLSSVCRRIAAPSSHQAQSCPKRCTEVVVAGTSDRKYLLVSILGANSFLL